MWVLILLTGTFGNTDPHIPTQISYFHTQAECAVERDRMFKKSLYICVPAELNKE